MPLNIRRVNIREKLISFVLLLISQITNNKRRSYRTFPWNFYRLVDRWITSKKHIENISIRDKIVLTTRSINGKLYDMSDSLIELPFQRIKIVGLNRTFHSLDYLYLILRLNADWVINIDEDCFVMDNDKLLSLLCYMEKYDFVFCGMPDGGVCKHRLHNPVAPNTYFNILNSKLISSLINKSKIRHIDKTDFSQKLVAFFPKELVKNGIPFEFDNFEPYYCLFFWLLLRGSKPLFLPSAELEDGFTTELRDQNSKPLLLHTWYAREYDKDEFHTKRINCAYEYAKRFNV